jgi:hypothetical protein
MTEKDIENKMLKEKDEAALAKQKEIASMLRAIVKDKLYPLVRGEGIDKTSVLVQVVYGRIVEAFNLLENELKVSELKVAEFDEEIENKVFDMVKDLTPRQAANVLQGFDQAINACIRSEQKSRKIEELELLREDFEEGYVREDNK